jgi:hypothetical protein
VQQSDIVDVLREQHDRIRHLCADVEGSRGADRERHFAQLRGLLHRHELGDRTIVHPAARKANAAGDAIGVACMTEGGDIERAFAALTALGVAHASFDVRFTAVHEAILRHTEHEERDEFPVLRLYVGTQRRHMMVGELHDLQVMAG